VHDLRALQFQVDGQVQWDYRAHVYILRVRRKSLTGDHQVIRIERHIWNQKTAGIIRSRGPVKAAHWVADFYCGIWHNGSGWIKNRTAHRSRVAGGLAKCAQSRHKKRSKKNSRTGRHSVRSLHDVPPNFFIGLSRTASYACGGGRMYSEETKGEECQTIAGISGRTDDAKIGAGWATTFTATPAWASAQSEHDRSARPESFGCTCTTATKLVRKTSRTQNKTPRRHVSPQRHTPRSWIERALSSSMASWGFMSVDVADLRWMHHQHTFVVILFEINRSRDYGRHNSTQFVSTGVISRDVKRQRQAGLLLATSLPPQSLVRSFRRQ